MTVVEVARVVIFSGSAIGVLSWLLWSRTHWHYLGYAIAPASWLLHVAVFYFVRLFIPSVDAILMNYWSLAIYMHGILLCTGAAWATMQKIR